MTFVGDSLRSKEEKGVDGGVIESSAAAHALLVGEEETDGGEDIATLQITMVSEVKETTLQRKSKYYMY